MPVSAALPAVKADVEHIGIAGAVDSFVWRDDTGFHGRHDLAGVAQILGFVQLFQPGTYAVHARQPLLAHFFNRRLS